MGYNPWDRKVGQGLSDSAHISDFIPEMIMSCLPSARVNVNLPTKRSGFLSRLNSDSGWEGDIPERPV